MASLIILLTKQLVLPAIHLKARAIAVFLSEVTSERFAD